MRSKGSRFTLRVKREPLLGVWGLRVSSPDVAFMFATVRNRPQPSPRAPYGRAYGKFCKRVTFGGFTGVAPFRVASAALRDSQTCFVTCRKSSGVAGAILLRRFRKMRCSFRGRRSTLDVSIVILQGRRNTLDVSCCPIGQARLFGAK